MQTMTLEQFRAMVDAGGVLSVTLKAQGAGFMVNVETRRGEAVMVRARDKAPRRFVDPRKAMVLLRDLGIREARVGALIDYSKRYAISKHAPGYRQLTVRRNYLVFYRLLPEHAPASIAIAAVVHARRQWP
jgi:hypothetical protein